MNSLSQTIRVGTRSSKLALLQTRFVLQRLGHLFPELKFAEVALSSPGDRDQMLALNESPPDFFTRDLDDQVLDGTIDCAVHSAKDLPEPLREGLDGFWLPWHEDARDALVCREGVRVDALPADARIGVSSERRIDYCRRRFPTARLLPIRGAIPKRLQQLDEGGYDMIVVAGAALNRLGLGARVSEWITLAALPPPEGQGVLALTFRGDDDRFLILRGCFVKAVVFAGAGVGSVGACTVDTLRALERADVCLHDTLLGHDLLQRLPPSVRRIDVGKRCGAHSVAQKETTAAILRYACQGLRVVRLKGGDPGIFGRLAEETAALDARCLPYRVLPGVSSLTAATTATGMLLTRRGVSRGFTVLTPRCEGGGIGAVTAGERAALPMVFFMAITAVEDVVRQLLESDGLSSALPAAVVFGAGGDQTEIVTGDLATIAARAKAAANEDPGLLIVGSAAICLFGVGGALQGRRVLITASEALQERAAGWVADAGGIPVCRPLIRLSAAETAIETLRQIGGYEWVVLTSPSAVRCFGDLMQRGGIDLRRVRRLASCGEGTTRELMRLGLTPDATPQSSFCAAGLVEVLRPQLVPGARVLRLASASADATVAAALRAAGAIVDECLLYHNEPIRYDRRPCFDAVFFASASAVTAFAALWGAAALADKTVAAIGAPTVQALTALGVDDVVVGERATVEGCLAALAVHAVRQRLAETVGSDR